MTTTIKAIETRYKGYRMRSRLEARWAVFFDAWSGDRWEYESEGFDLGEVGWYLPDFRFRAGWGEIKPSASKGFQQAMNKCAALASITKESVILISGNPWPGEYHITYFAHDWPSPGTDYRFSAGGFVTPKYDERIDDELMNAFKAARSARFEHGESGYTHG